MTDAEVLSVEGYRNLYIFCNIHFTSILPLRLSITNPERYDHLDFYIPHSLAAALVLHFYSLRKPWQS